MDQFRGSLQMDIFQLLFFPAVVLHELSHWVAYRVFGYESEINLHCFSFDRTLSHVRTAKSPSAGVQFLSSIAPISLLCPAFLVAYWLRTDPAVNPLIGIPVELTGLGLVVSGFPSQTDLRSFFVRARRFDGAWISVLARLISVSMLAAGALWLSLVYDGGSLFLVEEYQLTIVVLLATFVGAIGKDKLDGKWVQRRNEINLLTAFDQLEENNYETAYTTLEKAGELDASNARLLSQFGSTLFYKGHREKAAEYCKRAVSLNPDDALVQLLYADILLEQESLQAAKEHCQNAVRIDPRNGPAYACHAEVHLERDEIEQAQEYIEKALSYAPDDPGVVLTYAKVLAEQGELEDAEHRYQQVVEMEPENSQIHRLFAEFLEKRGDLERAEKQYQQALDIEPENELLQETYAEFLESQDRNADATENLRKADAPTTAGTRT